MNSIPPADYPGDPAADTNDEAPRRRGRWLSTLAVGGALAITAAAVGVHSGATDAVDTTTLDGASAGDSDFGVFGRSTGTAVSGLEVTEATPDEEQGVVIIEAVHGYANAASAGTGIVLTSDGLVLTNNHVVEGSTEIAVTVPSTGEQYEARVVGTDATSDIAVIELQDADGLTVADLDDNDDPAVGDDVTGVGNAYGEGVLVAADGTVTALGQTITAATARGVPGETLDNLIEVDADIVSGDSGGPLLDDEGEVVGVNTAASDMSTMPAAYAQDTDITAYAVPIDDAMDVVDTILAGEETDTVTIGYPAFLGVQLAAVESGMMGRTYDGYPRSGAVIGGVIGGTPAADAGLRAGDTIVGVDDTPISSGDDLSQTLDAYRPGDDVTITWITSTGQTYTASITLAEGPAQ